MRNKYQNALDRMKILANNDWTKNYSECKDKEKTVHIYDKRMFEIDAESIKCLQELVDKETPAKPYKDDLSYSGYKCPNCDSNIFQLRSHNIVKTPYCIWCGQKLDWSEENDRQSNKNI